MCTSHIACRTEILLSKCRSLLWISTCSHQWEMTVHIPPLAVAQNAGETSPASHQHEVFAFFVLKDSGVVAHVVVTTTLPVRTTCVWAGLGPLPHSSPLAPRSVSSWRNPTVSAWPPGSSVQPPAHHVTSRAGRTELRISLEPATFMRDMCCFKIRKLCQTTIPCLGNCDPLPNHVRPALTPAQSPEGFNPTVYVQWVLRRRRRGSTCKQKLHTETHY